MGAEGRHQYRTHLKWTGAAAGFAGYDSYDRTHRIAAPGKPTLVTSAGGQELSDELEEASSA